MVAEIIASEPGLRRTSEEAMTLEVTGHYHRPELFDFEPLCPASGTPARANIIPPACQVERMRPLTPSGKKPPAMTRWAGLL